jgi:hypothetical protein
VGRPVTYNRPIPARARFPVVSGQQMRDEGVDFPALIPADFTILVQRNVFAPARLLRAQNCLNGVALQLIQQLTSAILRHRWELYTSPS